jgi:prepilin-type N-terminal cleavage/methylation domain-containing protein
MTNLVDRLNAPLRAHRAAPSKSGHPAAEPCHTEVLRGVRSASRISPLTSDLQPPTSQRRALTLIEMLVALAITLVMMAAVVNLFANMSASIRNRRAAIETGSQLRQVRNRMAMDLSGATCRGSTWQDPAENQGYIEIFEGEWSDKNPSSQILPANVNTNFGIDPTISLLPGSQAFDSETGVASGPTGTVNIGPGAVTDGRGLGDWDDVLALTVRSESDPFVARDGANLIESSLAEVMWFAIERGPSNPADPNNGFRSVHRKVLLIAPWLGPWGSQPPNISAHLDQSTGRWVANTLSDLTKRENRSYHDNVPANFPHFLNQAQLIGAANNDSRVLDSSLAFDVRVFDPGAPLVEASGTVLEPNDFGWPVAISAASPVITGYGAYCDLGWGRQPNTANYVYPKNADAAQPLGPGAWPSIVPVPQFHITHRAGWHSRVPGIEADYPAVYDTWSYHYENDGIDQDPAAPLMLNIIDQGSNGLDDNNANGVDDRGERETSPPYDVPLRGVKVILRVYEPDSRQIRESSVTHSFKQ